MTIEQSISSGEAAVPFAYGGLSRPQPVHIMRLLANQRQYSAQRVLGALVNYSDMQYESFPSYEQLMVYTKMGRGSIRTGLKFLSEYGLTDISKRRGPSGHRMNYYKILRGCYQINQLDPRLHMLMPRIAWCQTCGEQLTYGEFKIDGAYSAHYGCSGSEGNVIKFTGK